MNSVWLGGLLDLASLDAGGANLHSARPALRQLHPNRLQIGIKPTRCSVVRMRHVITELGPFAADFATFRHCIYHLKDIADFATSKFPHQIAGN
jgi:hypothetical protein